MATEQVEVANPSGSEFVSDLLRDLANGVRAEGGTVDREERGTSPGKKGEIITAILVGLATSALYDLLKAALKRMRSRPDFEGSTVIRVDGREVKLQVLVDDDGS